MSVINLDQQIVTEKVFIIGGKQRYVKINDETIGFVTESTASAASIQYELGKKVETLEKLEETGKELDIYKESKTVIEEMTESLREVTWKFFDSLCGNDTGKEIYNYYHKSTQAMLAVMQLVEQEMDVAKKENRENKRKKYQKSR
ncbi:hypothetical protein QQG09_07960 [Melissococcus plutonius]|uniref:hypothetical protein n=1 Tax=Melissococcus plutonius TaxID=33970 RepID=UPI0021E5708A|nr:hypothetical protein [Melissococcus plutonius]MCV2505651.1 hypothetical protein [Melissococcus plutonius]